VQKFEHCHNTDIGYMSSVNAVKKYLVAAT
jgi:hypothetical protein